MSNSAITLKQLVGTMRKFEAMRAKAPCAYALGPDEALSLLSERADIRPIYHLNEPNEYLYGLPVFLCNGRGYAPLYRFDRETALWLASEMKASDTD